MKCTYCNKEAKWVENKKIYGKNYGKSFMIWLCPNCYAYVGCHQNTKIPLGTMADAKTRLWRMKAHQKVDTYWQNKTYTRKEVYQKLKDCFGYDIHIGESNAEQCKKIICVVETLIDW